MSCLRSGERSLIVVVMYVSGIGMRLLYFKTCHVIICIPTYFNLIACRQSPQLSECLTNITI